MHFQILGAGAWGTALAITLARGGHRVALIPRSTEHLVELKRDRSNARHLPGILIPESVALECWHPSNHDRDTIHIVACPTAGLQQWGTRLAERAASSSEPLTLISLAKGLEMESLQLPTELLASLVPGSQLYALSGPNFAPEVAAGLPAAAVLAGDDTCSRLHELQEAFNSVHFRIYTSTDRVGVELGGALKNVYAIGMGICEGLRLGDNAKAALLTRSLREMTEIIPRLQGRRETAYGLSGTGDLVATCYGRLSRNRGFGEAIGRGEKITRCLEGSHGVVEGYRSCANFHNLFLRHGLNGPILEQLYAVLHEGRAPEDALRSLMSRELKPEMPVAEARK